MGIYDVAIIGAGLAGLQCARLLAEQGLKVALVDRKTTLDQKIHTTGIFVRKWSRFPLISESLSESISTEISFGTEQKS